MKSGGRGNIFFTILYEKLQFRTFILREKSVYGKRKSKACIKISV